MTGRLPGMGAARVPDDELDKIERFFGDLPDFTSRVGTLIRRAFDEVIDGPRTGRWSLAQLEQPEKTYIGIKIEILLRAAFALPRGARLDCRIEGVEVDIKFTIGTNWAIPREAFGYICLLVMASDTRSVFSIGLLRMSEAHLNTGQNRDQKRTVNKLGREETRWIAHNAALPENILLHLPEQTRQQIFSHTASGQKRVDELFRLVQNRIIPRQTVEIVARQKDPLKRGREARQRLLEEGIVVICGTYSNQQEEARSLGLPVPRADEWISTTAPAGWRTRLPNN